MSGSTALLLAALLLPAAAHAQGDTAPLLKPNAAYARYLRAPDPAVYFSQARDEAGDEKYFASEALRLCVEWVPPSDKRREKPVSLVRLSREPYGKWKTFALAEIERCKGFGSLQEDLAVLSDLLRAEAAREGSMPALARVLVNVRKSDPAGARRSAIRVLESRDASAIEALWPFIEQDGVPARMKEITNASNRRESVRDAWFAMACGNGLYCGPDSTVMKGWCNGPETISCQPTSYARMLEDRRGPSDRDEIERYARLYADIIRKSQWERFGLR